MPAAAGQPMQQQQQPIPPQQPQLTPQQRAILEAKLKQCTTVYPQYIDAALTPKQGRRTTLQHAVAHPTLDEMFQATRELGFTTLFCDPRKSLPRAQSQPYCIPPLRGVLKVIVEEGEGDAKKPVVEGIPNKSTLLRAIADKIKAIPDRKVVEQGHAQRYASELARVGAESIVQGANKKIKKPKRQVIRGR